jgi:hypothetical protein
MRVGFTIAYNAEHHLREYGEQLAQMLDLWVVVEGAAQPGGSTAWCKPIDGVHSTDGTGEIIKAIVSQNRRGFQRVRLLDADPVIWGSKDEMVQAAAHIIRREVKGVHLRIGAIFLWQIDADEVWTEQQMYAAEQALRASGADCGCFHADHYVGEGLVARGEWGEGNAPDDPLRNAYRRLWRWRGQQFKTHEPPELEGGNGRCVLLPQRFTHNSYRYEKDVIFKSRYYQGYEDLHKKWLSLQKEMVFPQPISRLINGYWGQTATVIERI